MTLSLLLGFGHVTWFGQQDVSRLNTSSGLRCACAVTLTHWHLPSPWNGFPRGHADSSTKPQNEALWNKASPVQPKSMHRAMSKTLLVLRFWDYLLSSNSWTAHWASVDFGTNLLGNRFFLQHGPSEIPVSRGRVRLSGPCKETLGNTF